MYRENLLVISESIIHKIKRFNISLEDYYVLYSKFRKTGWTSILRPNSEKYQQLKDKGLLTQNLSLSVEGIEFCSKLFGELPDEGNFEEWWELYPRDDKFGNFPFTRIIRTNKREAKRLYQLALAKGLTHEQLMGALKSEIAFRKKGSTSTNSFKYMFNPVRWLSDEGYSTWLDKSVIEKINTNLPDII